MINLENYFRIKEEADKHNAVLIAVSKKKSEDDIRELLRNGQKIFGENYVREVVEKQNHIKDAEWHFIGHLQTNKVRQLLSCVTMIQSIDSMKLLKEVSKHAIQMNVHVDCLLEVFIASEETKSGFDKDEIPSVIETANQFRNINIRGLMGMASHTEDDNLIRKEFNTLRQLFEKFKSTSFNTLSMGMTSDYKLALEEGSTMIRVGSAIFGER